VGVEVHSHVDSAALTKALLDERIVTKETRKRTFRFTPPIVTDEATIDEIIARVGRALAAVAAHA
jgi:ornithine--oxo-acid transaminase